MREDTVSRADLDDMVRALYLFTDEPKSLEEVTTWIKSQHGVVDVVQSDYLVKTNPPQSEFQVRLIIDDGSIMKMVFDFEIDENEKFKLYQVHDSDVQG